MLTQPRDRSNGPPLPHASEREQLPLPSGNWRHVRFSAAELARGEQSYLKDSFYALYLAAGQPKDMGLYMSSSGHHATDFYFNPKAAHYAHSLVCYYAGEPCPRPHAKRLALVIGRTSPQSGKARQNNGRFLAPLRRAVTRLARATLAKRGDDDGTNNGGCP